MVFSPAPMIAAVIVANQAREREIREQKEANEKRKKKKQEQDNVNQLLLLNREVSNTMEIKENEKVVVVRVYESTKSGMSQWISKLNNKKIAEEYSFSECFEKTMQELRPLDINLVPCMVKNNRVDMYLLLAKVVDEDAKTLEDNLKEMANKMSETIKTSW